MSRIDLVELESNVRADLADGWDPLSVDNDPCHSKDDRTGEVLSWGRNGLQQALFPEFYGTDEDDPLIAEAELTVCKLLMEHGVHPDDCKRVPSWQGFPTPLTQAIKRKNLPVVQLFLDHGADPNLTDFETSRVSSPLLLAARQGNQAICSALLKHGADPNSLYHNETYGPFPALDQREEVGFTGNINDYTGALKGRFLSPLHLAAVGGHSAVCQVLLEHGADPLKTAEVSMSSYGYDHDAFGGWKETPAQAADRAGHPETAGLIRSFVKEKSLAAHLTNVEAENARLRSERDQLKNALAGVLGSSEPAPATPERKHRL
ncbi:ankyrin repeat domain-containing protein [Stenotrophomonas maltophilia]|uniref:ankyrin repeat domain-containing protein n=1 Tax=Stenotrophomonas maltophilia TaxID=40324 RepID=UPI0013D9C71A|nr:ankyrin repeat domain-containing protein [Stenotrophomonas maltophilia]MBH1531779.1 ankyrin repeat domain-containing protein [Stenotrophomonas maltophilia]HDS1196361.1 ankyrin repeat domain-containing protein [Stenotrophomonas maltophilia]HDS1564119.1 ankyrin repeat domain-containing protein [Stenotrophomonas maltophilia]